jgi:hypothetical protein
MLILSLGLATPAASAAPAPEPVVIVKRVTLSSGGTVAEIIAKYKCAGGDSGTHLWVSVKQGGPDPTAGNSGSTVTSWYDSHPEHQIHCDGQWHTHRFVANLHSDKVKATFADPGWMQFCLFDNTGQLGYDYEWMQLQHPQGSQL